ncbi:hypothetical protein DPMD02_70 [Desulfofustis phage LS06-2018-MD02]|nr:hypothetical protein DPMD02_70 [Desulfofustis phage LS06-2018-MD02]
MYSIYGIIKCNQPLTPAGRQSFPCSDWLEN